MINTPKEAKRDVEADIEEIITRLGRLSLTPAPTPSITTLEKNLSI